MASDPVVALCDGLDGMRNAPTYLGARDERERRLGRALLVAWEGIEDALGRHQMTHVRSALLAAQKRILAEVGARDEQ